jgi:hypothetical protein
VLSWDDEDPALGNGGVAFGDISGFARHFAPSGSRGRHRVVASRAQQCTLGLTALFLILKVLLMVGRFDQARS